MEKCEDHLSLSIYRLRKFGLLYGNVNTRINWGERSSADIQLYTELTPPILVLSYTLRHEQKDLSHTVRLYKEACHFGGFRWWMECGHCHRKQAKLYLSGATLACRRCLRLSYESQGYSERTRAIKHLVDGVFAERPQARSKYWKGRPTKRMRQYENKIDKMADYPGLNLNF